MIILYIYTYTYRIVLMHFASVGLEPFGLAQCIRPLVQRIQTLSPGISFASAELCSAQPHFTSCKGGRLFLFLRFSSQEAQLTLESLEGPESELIAATQA